MTRAASLALIVIALSVLGPGPAPAASFDCTKAGTAVEKMICGDPTLSRLDEDLSEAYRQTLSADPEPETLKAQQRVWLRDSRDNCTIVACLREMYKNRIDRLRELATFAAATGRSEPALADFLQAELELEGKYYRPRLVPLRSPTRSVAKTVAFFGTSQQSGIVKRGLIDVSGAEPRVLGVEDYKECHCPAVNRASAVRFVATELDFVVVEYSPGGGTCQVSERMDIFRAGENGTLDLVWTAETYDAGGTSMGELAATIVEISFPLMRDNDRRAILRSVRGVRCGDEYCYCRDGPLLHDFVELFLWDPATRRFRPAR